MDTLANEIAKIKVSFFKGITRINLTALNFKHPLARDYYRKPSNKKIVRLRNIFKLKGYLRLDDENFIKAIINNNILTEALRAPSLKANIFRHRPESIGEIPRLLLL